MYDLSLLGSPTTSDPNVSGGKILTLRMGKAKAGPVVSDNGNFIVDAPFPKEMMKDPKKVSVMLEFYALHVDLSDSLC
jgi:ribose 5-phosphate isomerase